MQTGDLVLFRGRGPVAWFIRTWTRSAWAHCGVLLIIEGVPMVSESRFRSGVACNALANRMKDIPTIYPTNRTVNIAMAISHSGDEYSAKDAIRAGVGKHGHHAGWECAEWSAFLLGVDHETTGWRPQNLAEVIFAP